MRLPPRPAWKLPSGRLAVWIALLTLQLPVQAAAAPEGCLSCHQKLAKGKAVEDHSDFNAEGCAVCHAATAKPGPCKGADGKAFELVPAASEGCLSCHEKAQHPPAVEGKTLVPHPGVGQGLCLGCHSPHGSEEPGSLAKQGSALCLRCHGPDAPGNAKARIDKKAPGTHKAVKSFECQECHNAGHTGTIPKLLAKATVEVCLDCHDKPEAKSLHTPVEKGLCAGCHDPHGSPEGNLLRGKGKALCLRCHAADAPTGEGTPSPEMRIDLTKPDVHKAVKSFPCQECHGAPGHGGDLPKLLLKPAGSEVCYECHDPMDAQPTTHKPVKEGKCLACHDPHVGVGPNLIKKRVDELCFSCHEPEKLLTEHVTHAPVGEGMCLTCHNPHGSEGPKLLRETGTALCKKCHDSTLPESLGMPRPTARIQWKRKVNHKAVSMEGCKGCHVTGHSGSVDMLLLKSPPGLCMDCHETPAAERYTHGAVKNGDCAVCHDPHSADQPNLLRKEKPAELCFLCHQDDVTGRAFVHKPVGEGKCLECHNPHGSPNKFNLINGPGKKVCLACHDPMDKGKNKHKALGRIGCTGCHDPHGSGNRFMLATKVNELCTGCHTKITDGYHVTPMAAAGHKISGGVDPRHPDREMSCASCHNPHGSDNPRFFYWGKDNMESCAGCHGDKTGKHPEMKNIIQKSAIPKSSSVREAGAPPPPAREPAPVATPEPPPSPGEPSVSQRASSPSQASKQPSPVPHVQEPRP